MDALRSPIRVRSRGPRWGFVLLLLVPTGCEPDMGAAVLEGRVESWVRALEAGDAQGLSNRYERGGVFLPPGEAAVVGREAILERWRPILARYEVRMELEVEGMDADGRVGHVHGRYRISGVDRVGGETFSAGDGFLQIWRRQRDGGWLIALDVWYPSPEGPASLPAP
jgi:ketosteroid isomerase-like protein